MACEQYEFYCMGFLTEARWRQHLEECRTCRDAAAADDVILQRVRTEDMPVAGDALWQDIHRALETEKKSVRVLSMTRRVWVWTGRVAAVLILGLGIGYGLGIRQAEKGTLSESSQMRQNRQTQALVHDIETLEEAARARTPLLTLDEQLRLRDHVETLDIQIREVREALAGNPGNRYLRQALVEALKEKSSVLKEWLHQDSGAAPPETARI